jgi:hypothetical protein
LTVLRPIAGLASVYAIQVIPQTAGVLDCVHFTMAPPNAPWSKMFVPPPDGHREVYRRFEEDNQITRGSVGIYKRPSERPGLGWELDVAASPCARSGIGGQ